MAGGEEQVEVQVLAWVRIAPGYGCAEQQPLDLTVLACLLQDLLEESAMGLVLYEGAVVVHAGSVYLRFASFRLPLTLASRCAFHLRRRALAVARERGS